MLPLKTAAFTDLWPVTFTLTVIGQDKESDVAEQRQEGPK